ncbi:hypothetical protein VOLCADRAFT_87449 [Volvox carteri f. nagariensis]|uniref:FAD dependent oxidoreductase domain-containing protein n=1 Tax=Volvox carteri f. nagariensis TaxID=3068 RepID=D8TLD3_VOLCA|nr:uncharacterized protein VOLCADRAFT_87449 [Volvox carteri f. nagariensis]EFJ51714.1 hypothetical protein VOLCADRAFT_87449 [Volvox carteri f. nagariensis]|eukprot:XP_002947124.1 hypothetical protein VOLCADRAFT_87449 [Volvox carteri f. nagariensis]
MAASAMATLAGMAPPTPAARAAITAAAATAAAAAEPRPDAAATLPSAGKSAAEGLARPFAEAPSRGELAAGGRQQGAVHYAVVGAGLAGVATAWHLLQRFPQGRPIVLDMYDTAGIAAGGSGAAAGLLHPYSPRAVTLHSADCVNCFERCRTTTLPYHYALFLSSLPCPVEKLLWRGEEAMAAALELVAAAEAAAMSADPVRHVEEQGVPHVAGVTSRGAAAAAGAGRQRLQQRQMPERFVWHSGLVRPAASPKQAIDFAKAASQAGQAAVGLPEGSTTSVRHLYEGSAGRTADGQGNGSGGDGGSSCGGEATLRVLSAEELQVVQGLVLDVGSYLRALWMACQVAAAARGDGSCARFRRQRVTSLERMSWLGGTEEEEEEEDEEEKKDSVDKGGCGVYGKYDAIVVAAGAAAATIDEVERSQLPLQLCQQQQQQESPSLQAQARAAAETQSLSHALAVCSYPAGSPSLLGQPYLAAQGPTRLVVGATKSYGWTPEAALAACGLTAGAGFGPPAAAMDGVAAAAAAVDRAVAEEEEPKVAVEAAAAVEALRQSACGVWAPLSNWQVAAVREGVRALPPRTTHGSLPLLGRLAAERPWWLVAGLGSRGLVYHGWLARLTADAVLYDKEDGIPGELMAWRHVVRVCDIGLGV